MGTAKSVIYDDIVTNMNYSDLVKWPYLCRYVFWWFIMNQSKYHIRKDSKRRVSFLESFLVEYNKKLANEEVLHILCQRCWLLYSKLPIKKNSCHLYKKHFPKIVKTLGTFFPHKIRMMSNCKTYIYIYQTCLSLNYQTYHEIELSL